MSNDLIVKAGGVAPRYFRAPGGNWSAPIIAVAAQLGMRPLGWSVDPQDWRKPPVGQLIASVRKNTAPAASSCYTTPGVIAATPTPHSAPSFRSCAGASP